MNTNEPLFIGQVIKRLRIEKKLSQEELAGHSSLSSRTIIDIENNKFEPKLRTLYNLAIGLDIEFLKLMKEINDYIMYHET